MTIQASGFVFKMPDQASGSTTVNKGDLIYNKISQEGIDHNTDTSNDDPPSEKTHRLPRWTRQEILVLIQGRTVEECNGRKWRIRNEEDGRVNTESKWSSISSYCKKHGVNRESIQCRKRWSNLSADYRRIRDWEICHREQSYWLMRNDVRRENKLPGIFDKEVYDTLEMCLGKQLSAQEEEVFRLPEMVLDSGRPQVDEAFFSDFEQSGQEEVGGSPQKTMAESPLTMPSGSISDAVPTTYTVKGSAEKRKDPFPGEENNGDLREQLFSILEKNNSILTAHVEAQNLNYHLDRSQRRKHAESLVRVLGKLADALGRIADKIQ